MADEIDLANETADRWLKSAIAASADHKSTLSPRGQCLYCFHDFDPKNPLTAKKLFCDSECSEEFERETRLRRQR